MLDRLHEPSLEELKNMVSPNSIAYFSEGGCGPTAARQVCHTIHNVTDANVLQTLLTHTKTLRAPHGREFPIERVRRAIVCRLADLDILTSQNG